MARSARPSGGISHRLSRAASGRAGRSAGSKLGFSRPVATQPARPASLAGCWPSELRTRSTPVIGPDRCRCWLAVEARDIRFVRCHVRDARRHRLRGRRGRVSSGRRNDVVGERTVDGDDPGPAAAGRRPRRAGRSCRTSANAFVEPRLDRHGCATAKAPASPDREEQHHESDADRCSPMRTRRSPAARRRSGRARLGHPPPEASTRSDAQTTHIQRYWFTRTTSGLQQVRPVEESGDEPR